MRECSVVVPRDSLGGELNVRLVNETRLSMSQSQVRVYRILEVTLRCTVECDVFELGVTLSCCA